jgi:hypothetical protein
MATFQHLFNIAALGVFGFAFVWNMVENIKYGMKYGFSRGGRTTSGRSI